MRSDYETGGKNTDTFILVPAQTKENEPTTLRPTKKKYTPSQPIYMNHPIASHTILNSVH